MKLRKRIEKCQQYAGPAKLPFEIERIFPDIRIYDTGICFSDGGDIVSAEEAINALKYLLKELK